jgi:prevent-host-death family protein
MEVGIREAKNKLSKLVEAVVRNGEDVYLTRRGERIAKIVPAAKPKDPRAGLGMWQGQVNLYPGWDSPEEDKKIEEMFEFLREDRP